jgi:hypothetical protein
MDALVLIAAVAHMIVRLLDLSPAPLFMGWWNFYFL